MPAHLDDPDEKRKVREANAQLATTQANIDEVTRTLLETRQGKDFIWWLLGIGKVNQQPFAHNALTTSFNCGELNVGQQVLAQIMKAAPDSYVKLLKEKVDG